MAVEQWATKGEGVGLIVRAISFQDFQPMWSQSTVHQRYTEGETDDIAVARPRALHAYRIGPIVHRAVKNIYANTHQQQKYIIFWCSNTKLLVSDFRCIIVYNRTTDSSDCTSLYFNLRGAICWVRIYNVATDVMTTSVAIVYSHSAGLWYA